MPKRIARAIRDGETIADMIEIVRQAEGITVTDIEDLVKEPLVIEPG